MSLQAGAATANITPWLGVSIPGNFRPAYGADIHDDLLAKALVLDNGQKRIAMVTCDLIAMPESVANAAKARIQARCGIAPECVMINATHTHSGAGIADLLGVKADADYIAYVPLKIADAVELALRRMRPARIGFASANENRIAFYRRWKMKDGAVRMNPGRNNPDLVAPMGKIDPELAMLYVEDENETPIAAAASFSLHYIGVDAGDQVSPDYFGHFYRQVRHYLGGDCVPILWNAASGQINNVDMTGRRIWPHRGQAQARRMANVLAGHLLTEIQLMDMRDNLDLDAAVKPLAFSRKPITAEDLSIAERILKGERDYDTGPFSWVTGQPIPKDRVDTYALECQRLSRLPERLTAPVQVLKLGPAAIVALPGEIFVESGFAIKSQTSAAPLMLVSLANGYIGYVCTDHMLTQEGGYETWAALSSMPGVGTAPAMETLSIDLLKRLGF